MEIYWFFYDYWCSSNHCKMFCEGMVTFLRDQSDLARSRAMRSRHIPNTHTQTHTHTPDRAARSLNPHALLIYYGVVLLTESQSHTLPFPRIFSLLQTTQHCLMHTQNIKRFCIVVSVKSEELWSNLMFKGIVQPKISWTFNRRWFHPRWGWVCFFIRFVEMCHCISVLADGLEWCGLFWCIYQLFGLSFCRHPFTAEHSLLRHWCRDTFLQIWWRNKLILILDGLRVSTFKCFGELLTFE